MSFGKGIWFEIKESAAALIGIIILFGDGLIILLIFTKNWSWGWWFLVVPLFLIGVIHIIFPVSAIPIIFKSIKKDKNTTS
jgi:hypothetical protein